MSDENKNCDMCGFVGSCKQCPETSESDVERIVMPPTEWMIDAPRMLIMWLSFDGNQTIESLRVHLDHAGVDYSCWPDWAKEDTGHLTKSGIAELIYTMMVNAA